MGGAWKSGSPIALLAAGLGWCLLAGAAAPAAEIALFGPSPYASPADTPPSFLSPASGLVHVLEDFEDGSLEPGITIDKGWIINPLLLPGIPNLTDSVDGDDGTLDGTGQSGPGGHSWFHTGRSVTVSFVDPVTSAGLVWTDGDSELTSVLFEVLGANGQVLGSLEGGALADDVYWGTTDEDRFFGARSLAPDSLIHALRISNVDGGLGIELDHVQYQRGPVPLPEPSAALLALGGLAALGSLARRRPSAAPAVETSS